MKSSAGRYTIECCLGLSLLALLVITMISSVREGQAKARGADYYKACSQRLSIDNLRAEFCRLSQNGEVEKAEDVVRRRDIVLRELHSALMAAGHKVTVFQNTWSYSSIGGLQAPDPEVRLYR